MENINYENAKKEYQEKLKETDNSVRRLKTKLGKIYNSNKEVDQTKREIANSNAVIETNKAKFVTYCKDYFSKIFFIDEKYENSKNFKLFKEWLAYFNTSTKELECFRQNLENLDYDKCMEIISDSKTNKYYDLTTLSESSGIKESIIENVAVLENVCDDLAVKIVKETKKRDFFKKFFNVEKRNEKIKKLNNEYIETQDVIIAANDFLKRVEECAFAFKSLAESYENNDSYKMVRWYSGIKKGYGKYLKDLKERINYKSGIEEQIENLRSEETKTELLGESYNEEVLNELKKDPKFLIALGKASTLKPKDRINKFLVDELTK
ncbi:MAG: hypothetical protein J5779_01755 [Clostridia bacterium]|nr:hypothetical protein [Clostridia bacterium]